MKKVPSGHNAVVPLCHHTFNLEEYIDALCERMGQATHFFRWETAYKRVFMRKGKISVKADANKDYVVDRHCREIAEYWIVKILIDLDGVRKLVDKDTGITDNALGSFLGLSRYMATYDHTAFNKIVALLKKKKEVFERKGKLEYSDILRKNIRKVSRLITLNRVERDILLFAVCLKYIKPLESASRLLDDFSTDRLIHALSVLLGYKSSRIKAALSYGSTLERSGIVAIDRGIHSTMFSKIDLPSRAFADYMMNEDIAVEEMMRDSVRRCPDALLDTDDFGHIKQDLSFLLSYLKKSIDKKREGVNVLLYGSPGTGKTELAKAIAKALNVGIYEVSYADVEEEVIIGTKRLAAYKMAQSLFAKSNVMLMFDEVEDIVGNNDTLRLFEQNKGWMNRVLETNTIPTIWITNSISSMDGAMVRRFDMAVKIPIPCKKKRKEILKGSCGKIISKRCIDRVAENEWIAPALVTRAAKVVGEIEASADRDKAFERIVNNTLQAQGFPAIQTQKQAQPLPKSYDPALTHTDRDLKTLTEGIQANPHARLCLYGVSGTGKSTYGQYLAKKLKKPCIVKKGSDLLSKWVGGTEQNISEAFRVAGEKDAVLIFDEVDSFLQERRNAIASWEVTQVNEMLVQMENFEGLFIATTNLMEGLDQASLRRFDLKLKFDYLKPKQAWKLFAKECGLLGIDIRSKSFFKQRIAKLVQLTPGDFATVRRQHRFSPIVSAEVFLERLEEELSVKDNSSARKMGFL